jgi:hypothetical protein
VASYLQVKPAAAEGEDGGEGGEEGEAAPINNVPDLLAESKSLSWAGIGFGEEETYRLAKSLKVRKANCRDWQRIVEQVQLDSGVKSEEAIVIIMLLKVLLTVARKQKAFPQIRRRGEKG